MPSTIVLIDDDEEVLEALAETFRLGGYPVEPCASLMAAREHLKREADIVVVTDVRMPARDGFAVLAEVRSIDPDIPVILISGHADVPMAVSAMRQGAHDFVEKPADPAYVLELLRRASSLRGLVLDHRRMAGNIRSLGIEQRILGQSAAIRRMREIVLALAEVDSTVLIHGETGTGKATSPAPSRERRTDGSAESSRHIRARFSSTRSRACPWIPRQGCCACFRKGGWNASAGERKSPSISG